MVASLNGRITKGKNSDIYRWTSVADQKFFFDLIHKSALIVMGRSTYEAVRSRLKLSSERLRVVLTREPKRYAKFAKPGILEFSSENPKQLIKSLAKRGYKELLLVGGGEVNAAFLEAGLVDEILLTIEPVIFGTGKLMIADGKFNKNLKLIGVKKLNRRGTLLLRYENLGN